MIQRISLSAFKCLCCCTCSPQTTSTSIHSRFVSVTAGPSRQVQNPLTWRNGLAKPTKPTTSRRFRPLKASSSNGTDIKRPGSLGFPTDAYSLASRLRSLSRLNKLDEAVGLLRRARLDLVNAAVYNTLIHEVLLKKKNNLAWQLWMDASLETCLF